MRIITYMETVNYDDYQRLDTVDQVAIQQLTYQYITRALGGILGGGFHGAIAPLHKTAWVSGAEFFMQLGKCTFAFSVPNGTQQSEEVQTETKVVQFNPADAGHSNYPVDFTAARAIASAASWEYYPYIWARAIEYSTAIDNRRFWDVGSGTEVNDANYETRTVTRVEFMVAETEPVGTGWAKVARVTGWLAGDNVLGPVIFTEYWFDSDETYTYLNLPQDEQVRYSETTGAQLDSLTGIDDLPRTLGILHHLLFIRRQLRLLGSRGTFDPVGTTLADWDALPKLSVNGAYAEIETLKDTLDARVDQLDDHFVAASATVLCTPDTGTPNAVDVEVTHGRGISSITRAAGNPLIFTLEVSRPTRLTSVEWHDMYITSFQATEIYDATNQGQANARFPLRILPVLPSASLQVSDFLNVSGNMEFQIQVFQDQNVDGIWGRVEDGVDGFTWANFDPFRFAIVVNCSLNAKEV